METPAAMLLHPYNTARPVDARWQRVVELQRFGLRATGDFDDQWVREGLRFLRCWEADRDAGQHERLAAEMPDFAAAHRLHRCSDPLERGRVEALLLAGQSFEVVAAACDLAPAAVAAYEALHFQVRGRLDAWGFILAHAFEVPVHGLAVLPADGSLLVKLMGYRSGAAFAEAGVRFFRRGIPLSERLEDDDLHGLQDLAESLRVHAFVKSWTLPHPQCRRALRSLELADEVERHAASLRRRISGRNAASALGAGDWRTGNVGLPAPVPVRKPVWWAAIRGLAVAA
jgi:hypothetical protein